MMAKVRLWAIPALAALGLADAVYLSILDWRDEIPPCGGYSGCAQVNTSVYSEVFGVPVAYLGALLYAALLGISLYRVRAATPRRAHATLLLYGLTLAGAVFVVYLTSIELFVLGAICYWCVALAANTLALFGLTGREVWVLRRTA